MNNHHRLFHLFPSKAGRNRRDRQDHHSYQAYCVLGWPVRGWGWNHPHFLKISPMCHALVLEREIPTEVLVFIGLNCKQNTNFRFKIQHSMSDDVLWCFMDLYGIRVRMETITKWSIPVTKNMEISGWCCKHIQTISNMWDFLIAPGRS